ncbi:titin [Sabethes cyaneus]|uniref:titin n=1 Tax=Sabethes cyaneus TaxID=53552 RepID=UPI00237EA394|nr:titin [Sabethes cyaneus]
MERFAINILHKQIYKICRLCGVDNPVKFPIVDENETVIVGDDDEATLVRKIEECVGIQVSKDDRMPQNICSLCVDKINDFFEYRLMCAATNLQTRTILNLPLVDPTRKLIPVGDSPKIDIKDVKEDVKKVVEAASTSGVSSTSSGKKGKKRRSAPSPSPSPAPTTRVKAAVDIVKDEPVPTTPVKALTKKERLKQQQQQQIIQQKEKDDKKKKEEEKKKKEDGRKRKDEEKNKIKDEVESTSDPKVTRSKRKDISPVREAEKVEPSVPAPKKIKFEHPCSYCSDEFKTQTELDGHLVTKHTPMVRKFGCGSCGETFESVLEFKDHNLWHQLTRTMYTCFKCKRKYDKNTALVKHCALNACGRFSRGRPPTIKPDVQCRLCHKKFKTQNLYEWHSCFLKPKGNCPKCGKFFVKKAVLTRHYMMFCTGTLPPPEPVVIPKEEPIDIAEKNAAGVAAAAAANAERRTRRSVVVEPELPKEEREIPFPPPLDLVPDVPSSSKKKAGRKDTTKEAVEAASPALEQAKIASLLDSGAKLGRDTDIATINNLLSSVSEAIASLSEAKAKKKKKKKDKTKEKERVEEEFTTEETSASVVGKTPTPAETTTPTIDEKSEEERQAEALALEVCEMTLEQQLALCSGKQPMVVLAKTHFKQECTEIDTEPSQLQEPVEEEGSDNNEFDDSANDFTGFQEEEDDDDQSEQQEPQETDLQHQAEEEELHKELGEKQQLPRKEVSQRGQAEEQEEDGRTSALKAARAQEEEEDIPFPMPIKQEPEAESQEEKESSEPEPETSTASTPVAPAVAEKEALFDEQLALNIKREPGVEEEESKRPGSRLSAASPAVTEGTSPKPTIILKIKKEKGLLNASVEPSKDIRTIILDDDEQDLPAEKAPVKSRKNKVYKKPNILTVKIKQEKIDPAYERQEQTTAQNVQLPLGVQIKQEPIDNSDQTVSAVRPLPEHAAEPIEDGILAKPPRKKVRLMNVQDESASPVIAFDGVRIKQEKSDSPSPATVLAAEENQPKSIEKKKKSKVKINPFALFKQRMAAESAAKSVADADIPPSKPSQAPSPLPVITNVVGNLPASSTSSSKSSSGRNTPNPMAQEKQRAVPVIAQVTSIAAKPDTEFPMPIKQEPADEAEEREEEEESNDQQADDDDFPLPIKEEPSVEPSEEPMEEEEPEFPMPIKEEPTESTAMQTNDEEDDETVNENEIEKPERNSSEASSVGLEADSSETIDNENDSGKIDEEEEEAEDENVESNEATEKDENDANSEEEEGKQILDVARNDHDDNDERVNKIVNEKECGSMSDSQKEVDLLNEKETNGKELFCEEPENSTSPISDIPMDEYEENSQSRQLSSGSAEATEVLSSKNNETSVEVSSKSSKNTEESRSLCETEDSESHTTVQAACSETLMNKLESTDIAEPVSGSEPTPSQSDFEELQNLLTEGLKPTDLNYASSGAVESTANGSSADGLVDELDSLLNNKLEEISDQLKHPQNSAAVAAATPDEDISLAFERELLHEMMPPIQRDHQSEDAINARAVVNSSDFTSDKRLLDAGKLAQTSGTELS